MASVRTRRIAAFLVSLPLTAGLMTGLAPAASAALDWGDATVLSTSEQSYAQGLVALSSSTTVAVYTECCGLVKTRRTTDSGATWKPPVTVSRHGDTPAISGMGKMVDVTWRDEGTDQVMYRRSTDAGRSFHPAIALTGPSNWATPDTAVVRGTGGTVVALWETVYPHYAVKARVSTDGGKTFGAPITVAKNVTIGTVAVAMGDGELYVAYLSGGVLKLKTSANLGHSWSRAIELEQGPLYGWRQPSISAEGNEAYVVYPDQNGSVFYRRTADAGLTWSDAMSLHESAARPDWDASPQIALTDGIVRAVFYADLTPKASGIVYRESADGINWTDMEYVCIYGERPYLAVGNAPIVVYDVYEPGALRVEAQVRPPGS